MKKNVMAALAAVVLIAATILAGEVFQRARTTAPQQTAQHGETEVPVPAAATTKAPKTTLTETEATLLTAAASSTTAAPRTTATAPGTQTGRGSTYTGLFPLAEIHFTAPDPDNSRGLSAARIDHSFGVPKNGQVNAISVDRQKAFDDAGKKVILYDGKTQTKALYLTFDCGYENGNTAKILDVLKEKNVPAAFFCTETHIKNAPQLIARMINEGHIVGNHSDKHPDFSSISRTRMAAELETVENTLRRDFGYTTAYFRFPEGAYSDSAIDLVDALGYTSVFWSCAYADWDTQNTKGKQYAYDTVTSRLHPGAVILLHAVSPDNAAAMADIIDTARSMGYTFRSLDDFGKA